MLPPSSRHLVHEEGGESPSSFECCCCGGGDGGVKGCGYYCERWREAAKRIFFFFLRWNGTGVSAVASVTLMCVGVQSCVTRDISFFV
jgi:hypothetical protein